MLHWLHFRQQRACFWTPPSTRNVTFSKGKRTFTKPRSHDDIALFAQMLHWPHFRQQRASLWIPCSTQNVTFSLGKRTILAQMYAGLDPRSRAAYTAGRASRGRFRSAKLIISTSGLRSGLRKQCFQSSDAHGW